MTEFNAMTSPKAESVIPPAKKRFSLKRFEYLDEEEDIEPADADKGLNALKLVAASNKNWGLLAPEDRRAAVDMYLHLVCSSISGDLDACKVINDLNAIQPDAPRMKYCSCGVVKRDPCDPLF